MLCAHLVLSLSHSNVTSRSGSRDQHKVYQEKWLLEIENDIFYPAYYRVLKILSPHFSFPSLRSYNNFSHTSSFIPLGVLSGRRKGHWWLGSYGYGEDCVGYWLKTVSAPSSDTRVHWGDWTQDDGSDGIRPGISLSLLPLPPPVTLLTSPRDHLCDILPSSSNCFYIMLMKPGLPLMHQWLMCFLKVLCIFSFIIYICFSFEFNYEHHGQTYFFLDRRNALRQQHW